MRGDWETNCKIKDKVMIETGLDVVNKVKFVVFFRKFVFKFVFNLPNGMFQN